jgi:uncharacterized protein (DUF1015 family)
MESDGATRNHFPLPLGAVPTLRAFRALRYDPARVPDLGCVLCPPYDVISPGDAERLRARDAHNAVRLELPQPEPSGADDDSRYRAAARTLAEWRSDGTLRKDREPSITIHEMRSTVPDSGQVTVARGFLARLRLEPFGADGGVRPHERTMSGPKEDRYRLLRATGTNLSPVVALHEGDQAQTAALLDSLTRRAPDAQATAEDGVRHRVWIVPGPSPHDDETGREVAAPEGPVADVAALLKLAGSQPVTIADGHHRYETALRYREERGMNRACESDPAWDYVMALFYAIEDAPTVLPTHRVVKGGPSGEALLATAASLFEVDRLSGPDELIARMAVDAPDPRTAGGEGGSGRFGIWSAGVAAILRARPEVFERLVDQSASPAGRWLDVNLLAHALERLTGVDTATLAADGRILYTKDAAEAVSWVDGGVAASAFLLDPTPVAAVTRLAAVGEVMPQKSTYFHPKAPTGLLFGPLEW